MNKQLMEFENRRKTITGNHDESSNVESETYLAKSPSKYMSPSPERGNKSISKDSNMYYLSAIKQSQDLSL